MLSQPTVRDPTTTTTSACRRHCPAGSGLEPLAPLQARWS